jgi:hypothetical protein
LSSIAKLNGSKGFLDTFGRARPASHRAVREA